MITIYGKENCTFCNQAKTYLCAKAIDFEYISLDSKESVVQMKEEVLGISADDKVLVPVVIIEGNWIGGYNELKKYIEENYSLVGDTYMENLNG